MEVLDDIELMLLQNIVVCVEFVILLLELVDFGFCLLAQTVVQFVLLGHVLKLFFFVDPLRFDFIELTSLSFDLLLEFMDVH